MDAGVTLFIFQHGPLEGAVETHTKLNCTYTNLLRASCLRLLSAFTHSARRNSRHRELHLKTGSALVLFRAVAVRVPAADPVC